jgi:hypothetical protein
MRTGLVCGLVALALSGLTSPVRAQPRSDDEGARLLEEVAGLNRSLDRLVALLERSLENQRIDLLLKRVDLKERRLAPLEAELRDAENEVLRAETEIRRMEDMQERQERLISRAVREGTDQPDSEARRMIQKIEASREYQAGRQDEAVQRVRQLEDRLAEGRDEIAIVEATLNELLLQLLE